MALVCWEAKIKLERWTASPQAEPLLHCSWLHSLTGSLRLSGQNSGFLKIHRGHSKGPLEGQGYQGRMGILNGGLAPLG